MVIDEFARLVRQLGPKLTLYARQFCLVPEDIVQEAFVKLFLHERLIENEAAWLFRVVRNLALNQSRAEERRRNHEERAAERVASRFETVQGTEIDWPDAIRTLQQLPLEMREPIVLRIWGDRTFEEIATLSGSSTSTVYRNYIAGIRELRARLESGDSVTGHEQAGPPRKQMNH